MDINNVDSPVVEMTIPDVMKFLEQFPARGCKIVTLITLTHPELKPGNPFPKGITHFAQRQVFLGACYEHLVQRQREREGVSGVFHARELWSGYGTSHPDWTYGVIEDEWRNNATGHYVSFEIVQPWLREKGKNHRQETKVRVPWMTISLAHVQEIRYGGYRFVLHND